jgi:hypothetical protein
MKNFNKTQEQIDETIKQAFLEVKMVREAKAILAEKHNVDYESLEFIGIQDETEMMNLKLYHFNVMDPGHSKYKSTVSYIRKIK